MKRYVRPEQSSLQEPEPSKVEAQEFDVLHLLSDSAEILRREIKNLMIESSSKKLGPNSAKDLVSYVKLLHDLKLEQEQALNGLSDEELKALKATHSSAE